MNRRELLQGGAALTTTLAAAALATGAQAATKKTGEAMSHAHHHDSAGHFALAHAATHCVLFGDACIGHCLQLLAEGNKEMAACAQSVEQMVSACNSLRQLATWNSPYVPRMAKLVMDMCKDCEAECRKHEKMHDACRKCADSCAECAAECSKVAA